MDLDANVALVSLNEAKEYLKIATAETSDDAIIHALINGISSWVSSFLGRNLVKKTWTEYYNGDGGKDLILRNRPLVSVASVYVDNTRAFGAASLLSSSYYFLQKYRGILRAWDLMGDWTPGDANIKVVYDAGYVAADVTGPPAVAATMPHGIRMAVKRILDHQFRQGYTHRKLDLASESVGDATTAFRDADIPKDAQSMLLPFRDFLGAPHFSYAD
jgi:hypothetical protein